MQIFVKTLTGKCLALDVSSTTTIREVKEMLNRKEQIPVDEQKLFFAGQDLENPKTLQDCGIQSQQTVHLLLAPKPPPPPPASSPSPQTTEIVVNVKQLVGEAFQLQLTPSMTIKKVKEKICTDHGMRVEEQRLIYAGKAVEDNQTVAECEIQHETTLHLILTVR